MDSPHEHILFYDGDCAFCNHTVRFILKNEKNDSIHFASLQSEFTRDFMERRKLPLPDLSTLLFYENGSLYLKSTAALRLTHYLKVPFNWLNVLRVFPVYLRDKCYDFIARHRTKFGKGFCLIPTPEQKQRFLG